MKRLILAVLCASAGFAGAINPCPLGSGTICPANTVCLSWNPPTTRESGAAIGLSEIANYQLQLNNNSPITVTGTSYNYLVPTDTTVKTTDTWSILTVDTLGNKSTTPASCLQPVAVAGKKSNPSAPVGLGITTGG
jgi:hypothetical protein